MCASVNKCRNHRADSSPSDTAYPLCCQCGSDNFLDGGTLPTGHRAQVKTSSFHQLRMMRETTNELTLRLLTFSVHETGVCETNNGTSFHVHDTTRNDEADFSCAFRLLDKFIQRLDFGERRLAQFLSRQRHTNVQVWLRLLSKPQQLSQHTSVSSDLSVSERAFQSSPSSMLMHSRLIVDLVCVTLM